MTDDLITRLRTACSPESPLGKLCTEAAGALNEASQPVSAEPIIWQRWSDTFGWVEMMNDEDRSSYRVRPLFLHPDRSREETAEIERLRVALRRIADQAGHCLMGWSIPKMDVTVAMQNLPTRSLLPVPPSPARRRAMQTKRKYSIGDHVQKISGYRWPGIVVAQFLTLDLKQRYVVECTVPEVAGALHIYSEDQLVSEAGMEIADRVRRSLAGEERK